VALRFSLLTASLLLLTACLTVTTLTACGGRQMTQFSGGPPSQLEGSAIKRCRGTNGVVVRPCPARLSRENDSTRAYVEANGIENSQYIGGCDKKPGDFCEVARVGNSTTGWVVCSGRIKRKGNIEFAAYANNNHLIGYGYLYVINTYAPRPPICGTSATNGQAHDNASGTTARTRSTLEGTHSVQSMLVSTRRW